MRTAITILSVIMGLSFSVTSFAHEECDQNKTESKDTRQPAATEMKDRYTHDNDEMKSENHPIALEHPEVTYQSRR